MKDCGSNGIFPPDVPNQSRPVRDLLLRRDLVFAIEGAPGRLQDQWP